jgi:hypothetical protein
MLSVIATCAFAASIAAPPVQVVLDLDAFTPGFQSNINVPEGTILVETVAVYVFDPIQERSIWGIGYLGGIDRGIALGHMPDNANHGSLTELTPILGSPVNPDNVAWMSFPPGLDPGFIGPEVQYIEGGADKATVIPALPTEPIFTVDITLEGAVAGDIYDLYLLDFITVWMQYWLQADYGAFSTQGSVTLDTGGDAVPDNTDTIYGTDSDSPVPVPPAAFSVDYIDGPPGGCLPTGAPALIHPVPVRRISTATASWASSISSSCSPSGGNASTGRLSRRRLCRRSSAIRPKADRAAGGPPYNGPRATQWAHRIRNWGDVHIADQTS